MHKNVNLLQSPSQRLPNLLSAQKLQVGSWNLQGGLRNGFDFDRVISDLIDRKVQVATLQETHCPEGGMFERRGGKVICLEDSSSTPTAQRYGLGFFIGTDLFPSYLDHRYISNRIAILRLQSPYGGATQNRKFNTICIVNVYAPSSQFAIKHPEEYHGFYEQLNMTVEEYARKSCFLIIAGDCNSKLGLRECKDDGTKEAFMGPFGKGTRNRNGGYFASFLDTQRLYVANTHFQHPMRHRTTWNGEVTNNIGQRIKIRNQIDYLMVGQCFKNSLRRARSHHGHEFNSDHALVVVQLRLDIVYSVRKSLRSSFGRGRPECETQSYWPRGQLVGKTVRPVGKQVDLHALAGSKELQQEYEEIISDALTQRPQPTQDESGEIQHILACIESAAKKSLPRKPKQDHGKVRYPEDPLLQEWSSRQKDLRIRILSMRSTRGRGATRPLRKARTKLFNQIQRRIKMLHKEATIRLAEELESTPFIQRKFEVHRLFRKKEFKPFELGDDAGNRTLSTDKMIELVTEFYTKFFNPCGTTPVDLWGEFKGELNTPLTGNEVTAAIDLTTAEPQELMVSQVNYSNMVGKHWHHI